MANYDKYDPISGGHRALLNAPLPLTNGGFFGGVSLNASGRVVPGTEGQSGLIGVLVKNVSRGPIQRWDTSLQGPTNAYAPIGAQAGDVVDIMTAGEIMADPDEFPAGNPVFVAEDGEVSTTSAAGSYRVGTVIEAGRIVIRFVPGTAPVA